MGDHKIEIAIAITTGVLGNWLTSFLKSTWYLISNGLAASISKRQKTYRNKLFSSAKDQHIYLSYLAIMSVEFMQANFLLLMNFSLKLWFILIPVAVYYLRTLFAIQGLYRDVIRLRVRWRMRGRIK